MKKIIIFAFSVMVLAGCAVNRQSEKTYSVESLIERRHFTIDVDYMYPMSGMPRHVDYNYSLSVHGDSIISYLPYFGRAHNVPYGGGKALNFVGLLKSYDDQITKKGEHVLTLRTRTDEDEYEYFIELSDDGSASISVFGNERDQIRFRGKMDLTGK